MRCIFATEGVRERKCIIERARGLMERRQNCGGRAELVRVHSSNGGKGGCACRFLCWEHCEAGAAGAAPQRVGKKLFKKLRCVSDRNQDVTNLEKKKESRGGRLKKSREGRSRSFEQRTKDVDNESAMRGH